MTVRSSSASRPVLSSLEIVLLLGALVVARFLASSVCHIYDDAFISYRYAQNFAHGLGMVFNPGAEWEPVLGTTTPGYTALLSVFIRFGADPIAASLNLNVAADVAIGWLLIQMFGRDKVRATLAVLGLASMPELARISMGGMEAPVMCFLALLATWCMHRERPALAGVAAGLCCTVRPEAVLLVAVLVLPALRKGGLVRFLAPVSLIGILYVIVLTAVYGSPIPHSVISKAQMHEGKPFLRTTAEILERSFLPRLAYVPAALLAIYGMLRLIVTRAPLRPFVLFALAVVASYLAARPHTWGWYYFVPLVAWVVGIAAALGELLERVASRSPVLRDAGRVLGVPVATAIALVGVSVAASSLEDQVTPRVYDAMARWAEDVRPDETGATILASDIGAIGYYSRGRILDSEGLTWPPALERETEMEMVADFQPDFILLTAERGRLRPLRASEDLLRAYYPIRRFSAEGAADLSPAIDDLPLDWVQDYILFQRRL